MSGTACDMPRLGRCTACGTCVAMFGYPVLRLCVYGPMVKLSSDAEVMLNLMLMMSLVLARLTGRSWAIFKFDASIAWNWLPYFELFWVVDRELQLLRLSTACLAAKHMAGPVTPAWPGVYRWAYNRNQMIASVEVIVVFLSQFENGKSGSNKPTG